MDRPSKQRVIPGRSVNIGGVDMHNRLISLAVLVSGAWAVAGAWLLSSSGTGAGTMSGHMMGSHVAPPTATSAFLWHVLPGAAAVVLGIGMLLLRGRSAMRVLAVLLLGVGLWIGLGPWILPSFGLGDGMQMGLTLGSFLRHVLPGAVVLALGMVALRGSWAGSHESSRARKTQQA